MVNGRHGIGVRFECGSQVTTNATRDCLALTLALCHCLTRKYYHNSDNLSSGDAGAFIVIASLPAGRQGAYLRRGKL